MDIIGTLDFVSVPEVFPVSPFFGNRQLSFGFFGFFVSRV